MNDTESQERRGSFRIDVTAMIKLVKPSSDPASVESYFHDLQAFALQSEMNSLNAEIDQLSERIKDIAAIKSIQLLHQQVQILAKMGAIYQTQRSALGEQTVNISEGGCSLLSDHEFALDEYLALALVSPPTYFSLFSFVRVCRCEPETDQFRIHLEFIDLTEKQRQELVRFMFQAQTNERKQVN